MNCDIIRDLLSNYVEGLTSEETNEEIREHLEKCEDCRKIYEEMTAELALESTPKRRQIPFFEKIKSKMRRRNIVIAISIICFGVFAWNYYIPLPFNPNRMFIETFEAIKEISADGKNVFWYDIDGVNYATSEAIVSGEHKVRELPRIAYQGLTNLLSNQVGRTIRRDGKEVRVVYYCHKKTLWDILFFLEDLAWYSESGNFYGTDLYGEDFYEKEDAEPLMLEIYYLPVQNLHKFEELTDEEFDAQKERASLIWSGII